jgi:hypothetical protein
MLQMITARVWRNEATVGDGDDAPLMIIAPQRRLRLALLALLALVELL